MDPIGNSSESSFFKDEKMEAADLLEECWFFDNLLKVTPKMTRCHSDPYPSTGLISPPDFKVKDSCACSYSSTRKPPNNGAFHHTKKIQRAPSMPPLRLREEEEEEGQKGSSSTRSKFGHQTQDHVVSHSASKPHSAQMKGHDSDCSRRKKKLLRTPSLPPSIGREEKFQVNDSRSNKQTSTPTHIDILPPRQTSKTCSIPRCRPARKTEVESFNTEGIMEMRRRYLSEAWLVQSCAPPIPNWASNKSAGDMKQQIKFWARAVASNVHQEC